MDTKDKQISEYKARIADLEQQVADLTEKLSLVLSQLSKQAIKKNSRNSSLPPSQDKDKESIKRTSSLREKSARSSGGQPGHKGSTLKMASEPDTCVDLKPKFCNCCGQDFPEGSLSYKKSRQVVDIPLSPAITTEYRQYEAQCNCGHRQQGGFPQGVNAPIQYGHNLEALVGYLSVSYPSTNTCPINVLPISCVRFSGWA